MSVRRNRTGCEAPDRESTCPIARSDCASLLRRPVASADPGSNDAARCCSRGASFGERHGHATPSRTGSRSKARRSGRCRLSRRTWNPSQINSNCALGNGNLTATLATSRKPTLQVLVRAGVTTGKFYWETTIVGTSIASDDAGVASAIRRPLPPLGWAILPIRLTIAAVITASQGAQSFSMEFSV